MSSLESDIIHSQDSTDSHLSTDQQRDLDHFKDISGLSDDENARQILDMHDWNLERAVNDFMGLSEPTTHGSGIRRRGVATTEIPAQIDLVPANQRIFQIPRPADGWLMTIFNFAISPLYLTYHLFFKFLNLFASFVWPDPRRIVTDPLGDVKNFIHDFKETYTTASDESTSDDIEQQNMPPFYEGTYAQALNEAKRSLRFLIVYLHGDSHEDTDKFCRDCLLHPATIRYLNNTELCIFWACNINSPEGYRTSQIFREHTYPFVGVIGLSMNPASISSFGPPSRMALLGRIEGLVPVEKLLEELETIINNNQITLLAARNERDERELTSRLRREQDEAYAESLAADRAKAAEKLATQQESLASAQRESCAEEKRRKLAVARSRRQRLWKKRLPQQVPTASPDSVKLSVKMPNGERVERVFSINDSIKLLYYFIISQESAPKSFAIESNFPKRIIECKPENESDIEDYMHDDEDGDSAVETITEWTPSHSDPPSFERANLKHSQMLFVIDLDM